MAVKLVTKFYQHPTLLQQPAVGQCLPAGSKSPRMYHSKGIQIKGVSGLTVKKQCVDLQALCLVSF